ncbi:MAG: hypothetical protein GY762_19625 [Proteobacteria bacterium]|nr:hypothetical protein [Pseudomonadota bacterium]
MTFVIDNHVCLQCGSCLSYCPNRAIIKDHDAFFVTNMCDDCGICRQVCAGAAINRGKTKTDFDNKKLAGALKEKLELQKPIAAMKYLSKPPEGVPVEEGPTFWCHICGDIFDGEGQPVYFTSAASLCGGSNALAIGAKRPEPVSREDFDLVMGAMVCGEGNLYARKELVSQGRRNFPKFKKIHKGMLIGPLDQVSKPDMILFPIDAHQLAMLTTAYAFDTGELITGYGGAGSCVMTVPPVLTANRPVFYSGDHGGRTHMRLERHELTICFPYGMVPGLVHNLDRTIYGQEEE